MMTAEQKAAWLSARAGRLTGSRMADAMSYLKNGQPSQARTKYMQELLAERLTGLSVPHVVTDAMLWGTEHEDEAVDEFVARYPQYEVRGTHFYEHPTIENFGATPDREIDHDGLLEVKCPTTTTYLNWVLAGKVPEQHEPQMAAQLLCSGKAWCGFIAYDPRIKSERGRMFMRKYVPTEEYLLMVETAAITFLAELDDMFDAFVTASA